MFHLIVHLGNLPPFPSDPRPAQLRRLLSILAWLHSHRGIAGAVVFGPGLAGVRRAQRNQDAARRIVSDEDRIEALRRATSPVPGSPGLRVDPEGRRWYSARWAS